MAPPEHAIAVPQHSDTLQEALRGRDKHGYRWLRFPAELETLFRDDLVNSGRHTRLVLLLLFAVMAAALPWIGHGLLNSPSILASNFLPIIYGKVLLTLVIVLVAWLAPLSKWVDWLCIASYLTLCVALLAGRDVGARYGFDVPLMWIALATTVISTALRLRFWFTMPWIAGVTVAAFVNETLFLVKTASDYFTAITLVLLTIVVCTGAYSLEYFMRKTWVNTRLLDHVSSHDVLTGLLNRKALRSHMQHVIVHALRERAAFAIAMIDIDFFKEYNDHYGHRAGDDVLREVAATLRSSTHRPHDLCGRYGGEEFIVVWTGGTRAALVDLAHALCERIEHAGIGHSYSRVAEVITVSIGLHVVEPEHAFSAGGLLAADLEDTVAMLWDAADQPLYEAKKAGRNRVVCSSYQTLITPSTRPLR